MNNSEKIIIIILMIMCEITFDFKRTVSSQEGEELTFPKVSRTDSGAYLW